MSEEVRVTVEAIGYQRLMLQVYPLYGPSASMSARVSDCSSTRPLRATVLSSVVHDGVKN